MATLTVVSITESGTANPSFVAAAGGGDVADNAKGDTILQIKNGSGGALVVTVTAQTTAASDPSFGALTKLDASISVPASGEAYIGPFRKNAFNNSSSQLAITYSGVTSLTIAAFNFRFPTP